MTETLAQALSRVGDPVQLLRNVDYPAFTFPVHPEFSNWRSESRSWNETVALMDQSHHMTQLFLTGEDVVEVLSGIAVNTFSNFRPGVAKQLISVDHDGHVIGDGILFHLNHATAQGERIVLIGHHVLIDWVRFHAERAAADGRDIAYRLEGNSNMREGDPTFYRYELQGPRAHDVLEKLLGGPVPEVRFFHIADFGFRLPDGGTTTVQGLRHGMAGQPGFEFFGPYAEGETVRQALLEAGAEFGIVRIGSKAYSVTPLESGWVPTPFPAIFSDDPLFAAYREWLPLARAGSIGGSLNGPVDDFLLTPYDLGLGRSVNFDHDFIGKEALQRIAESPARRKVTLIWNAADVASVVESQLTPGAPAKYLEWPKARYGFYQFDDVHQDGRRVGVSTDAGYVAYDQLYLSLASVDVDVPEGAQVELLWGEEPNSSKGNVEAHAQVRIRATVAPAPYHDYARTTYRDL
ncbi:aminomethyl transferase family protein [Microbacterium marinilacus]|uniref:Aminomethyltransferase family protein n=1 Tax=Microbacterium marinilacus TaxID=415209 RepID=A0ABP7BMA4_9MICO|nr:aminomethyl transferase family protein [Microbacterium marinilacus]MBY0690436.1 aminomethyl transferase family protein [Microbacterium marinilacus]